MNKNIYKPTVSEKKKKCNKYPMLDQPHQFNFIFCSENTLLREKSNSFQESFNFLKYKQSQKQLLVDFWDEIYSMVQQRLICYIKNYCILKAYFLMQEKKHSKSFKLVNHTTDNSTKPTINSDDPRIRVLQYDLVFANGLPSEIACKELLDGQLYFGRYGKVVKSILNPPYPYKKGANYQAYATYENELDASIAIVALDGFTLYDRPLKVSYGTTKYCAYFLKGKECTNNECIYLHSISKQNEVINGDSRTMFRQQNDRAIKNVLRNLETICERIIDSKVEDVEEGFPSLTEMIEFLIENTHLDEGKYYSVYDKVFQRKKKQQEAKQEKTLSQKNPLKEIEQIHALEELPKLTKSNSFSTMASPNKPQTSTEFDDEEKKVSQIDTKQQQKINENTNNEQFEGRTVRSHQQTKKCYQTALDFDQKMEENISQRIIKEIMRKKGVKSRFGFVQIDTKKAQTIEQIKRVKNIIQRFLITYQ